MHAYERRGPRAPHSGCPPSPAPLALANLPERLGCPNDLGCERRTASSVAGPRRGFSGASARRPWTERPYGKAARNSSRPRQHCARPRDAASASSFRSGSIEAPSGGLPSRCAPVRVVLRSVRPRECAALRGRQVAVLESGALREGVGGRDATQRRRKLGGGERERRRIEASTLPLELSDPRAQPAPNPLEILETSEDLRRCPRLRRSESSSDSSRSKNPEALTVAKVRDPLSISLGTPRMTRYSRPITRMASFSLNSTQRS